MLVPGEDFLNKLVTGREQGGRVVGAVPGRPWTTGGVPQGSVLGLLCFSFLPEGTELYMNVFD